MTFDMSLIIKKIPALLSQMPPSNVAMSGRAGSFFQEVLDQNYTLGCNDFNQPNNSEVMFTASTSKELATIYTYRLMTVIFSLTGKNVDTPHGWGYLVIGS